MLWICSSRGARFVTWAASLGIAESCLHRWKAKDLLDRGLKTPTPEAIESAALAACCPPLRMPMTAPLMVQMSGT